MIRFVPNHSAKIQRSSKVHFTFDAQRIEAHDGETVAVALLRAGHLNLRCDPLNKEPRGMFCCMGLCQECVVRIDGVIVESCRQIVSDGLVVNSSEAET